MESTAKRLELTQLLVELFKETPHEVIPRIVYLLQGKIRPEFEGVELGVAEKLAMRAISKSSGVPVSRIHDEYRSSGDLGHASSVILAQKMQTTFLAENITVERVYETLFRIARLEGPRSQDKKMKYISSLLNDAEPTEACYILKILLGTLRLGVAENTVMDALAVAFTGDKANRKALEHAYNVSSDLGLVAGTISADGLRGIQEFGVIMFNPVRPMLADRVKSEQEAVGKMGREFAAEYKLGRGKGTDSCGWSEGGTVLKKPGEHLRVLSGYNGEDSRGSCSRQCDSGGRGRCNKRGHRGVPAVSGADAQEEKVQHRKGSHAVSNRSQLF